MKLTGLKKYSLLEYSLLHTQIAQQQNDAELVLIWAIMVG